MGSGDSSVPMEDRFRLYGCTAEACSSSGMRNIGREKLNVRLLVTKPRNKFYLVSTGKKMYKKLLVSPQDFLEEM